MPNFKLTTHLRPQGDQPQAIKKLTDSILKGNRYQTLLGVTGSGKTFTLAHVINNVKKPTLIISHNKTLAAQLYSEFKELFPENAVEYFVSYYDYYQPEAYAELLVFLEKGEKINRDDVLKKLVDIHYSRNDIDFSRGRFRVRGEVIEIFPAY